MCSYMKIFVPHRYVSRGGRKRDPFNFFPAKGFDELGLASVTVGFGAGDLHIFLIRKDAEGVSFPNSAVISQPDVTGDPKSWYGRCG